MSMTVGELMQDSEEGDTYERVPSWHIGSTVLTAIEIHRRDGELFAEGIVPCGFDEHFTDLVGITYGDLDDWADKRTGKIDAWFERRYACVLENESWPDVMARFTIRIGAGVPLDEVDSMIESKTLAIKLYNESDPGTFNAEDLWRLLAAHLIS